LYLNGLDATRQIRNVLPNTEVLIFTMYESEALARELLAAGAHGFVVKAERGTVSAGRDRLTSGELEHLQLMAAGKTARRIAAALGFSVRTVDAHRAVGNEIV
jgi:DNA-binding NarL/FixJ family response regulator